MRSGHRITPASALALWLGCQTAAAPVPPRLPVPVPRPGAPAAPAPRDRTDEVAAVALRGQLLQLLPCDGGRGRIALAVRLGADGRPEAVTAAESTAPPEAVRCAVERVGWWRFSNLQPSRRELRLEIDLPLTPTTLQEHAAVAAPGGTIDLDGVARELRRFRPRVLACLRRRPLGEVVLLALRLGTWGRLKEVTIEADTGTEPAERTQREERACLRRVLRRAEFPNPVGGDVALRYPYVLTP